MLSLNLTLGSVQSKFIFAILQGSVEIALSLRSGSRAETKNAINAIQCNTGWQHVFWHRTTEKRHADE